MKRNCDFQTSLNLLTPDVPFDLILPLWLLVSFAYG